MSGAESDHISFLLTKTSFDIKETHAGLVQTLWTESLNSDIRILHSDWDSRRTRRSWISIGHRYRKWINLDSFWDIWCGMVSMALQQWAILFFNAFTYVYLGERTPLSMVKWMEWKNVLELCDSNHAGRRKCTISRWRWWLSDIYRSFIQLCWRRHTWSSGSCIQKLDEHYPAACFRWHHFDFSQSISKLSRWNEKQNSNKKISYLAMPTLP